MKFSRVRFAFLFLATFLVATAVVGQTPSISGPTCVQIGTSYQYQDVASWTAGSTSPPATKFTWTITGGHETGNSNTSVTNIGNPRIFVTWTGSGSLQLNTNSPTGTTSITVTVVAGLSGGALSNTSQTITYNTTPATINSSSGASGGACSPSYAYQWQSSLNNVSFSNITGQTALTLPFSSPLTATTYYRRMVTETGSGSVAYSNTATVSVMPQLYGNTVSPAAQDIFLGAAASNIVIGLASGGNCGGSYTYGWEYSNDNSQFFTSGLGSTNSLTPGSPVATIYYRRKVTCGTETAYSTVAAIYVHNHLSIGSISPGSQTITYNTSPGNLTATAA
ncbi:MAG TPA: hypothetical protein VGC95_00260, partial [Chitinophagaceae bacterium]